MVSIAKVLSVVKQNYAHSGELGKKITKELEAQPLTSTAVAKTKGKVALISTNGDVVIGSIENDVLKNCYTAGSKTVYEQVPLERLSTLGRYMWLVKIES